MFSYEALPGFFAQDDPLAHLDVIGAVPDRFGLLNDSDARWAKLTAKLHELNDVGDASYKLFFLGRHGQGYHNVAEAKYGTQAWDDHWAKLNGDDELTWGPDPDLTALGKAQAVRVNSLWKAERATNIDIPLPEKHYCSPMTRALDTSMITFKDVSDRRPLVLENCREVYGVHTCDKRHPRTHIQAAFPQCDIEDGFTEDDELWAADSRETVDQVTARARTVLDRVFRDDKDVVVISITAHGGIINGLLRAVGRPVYPLPTGGVLPIVVKATKSVS
ncbi:phosphoglycerate mutase-like protein [Mycena polygramma]|nr:phosphoglycerate mutase-like protein [Mycena polygramma]